MSADQAARIERASAAEEERRRQIETNRPLIALLDSWLNEEVEDVEAERQEFIEFMRGIDENRGERKLFTEILEKCQES
jgi:hypothetical protein